MRGRIILTSLAVTILLIVIASIFDKQALQLFHSLSPKTLLFILLLIMFFLFSRGLAEKSLPMRAKLHLCFFYFFCGLFQILATLSYRVFIVDKFLAQQESLAGYIFSGWLILSQGIVFPLFYFNVMNKLLMRYRKEIVS